MIVFLISFKSSIVFTHLQIKQMIFLTFYFRSNPSCPIIIVCRNLLWVPEVCRLLSTARSALRWCLMRGPSEVIPTWCARQAGRPAHENGSAWVSTSKQQANGVFGERYHCEKMNPQIRNKPTACRLPCPPYTWCDSGNSTCVCVTRFYSCNLLGASWMLLMAWRIHFAVICRTTSATTTVTSSKTHDHST